MQDLFQNPSIRGISAQLTDVSSQESSVSQEKFDLICLNKGDNNTTPLLLFNPAGASAFWYLCF